MDPDSTIFKRALTNFMQTEVLTTMNPPWLTAFKTGLEVIIKIIKEVIIKIIKKVIIIIEVLK